MKHSRCMQLPVKDVAKEALSLFSSKNEDGDIPLVLIPEQRTCLSWFVSIPTGCYCLMQRYGKDIKEASPGLNFMPPFYRISHVVTRQACTYNVPVQKCPTADNVMVHVDLVVIFNISDPRQFIYRMGAAQFDQLLSAACEEGVRMLVRSCYASSSESSPASPRNVIDSSLPPPPTTMDNGTPPPPSESPPLLPGAIDNEDNQTSHTIESVPEIEDKSVHEDAERKRKNVLELKGGRAELLFSLLNSKFKDCGVYFSDCKVTGVWLPDELSTSLEAVTEMQKKLEKFTKGHEFEMMKIRQESEMALMEIRQKNEQIVVSENGKKKRAEIEREQRIVNSESLLKVAVIEAQQSADIAKYKAEAALERKQKEMDKYLIELTAAAGSRAETQTLEADLQYEMGIIAAEADLQKLLVESKAVALEGEVEAFAAECVKQKRSFEMCMQERETLAEIALKRQFNLIGTFGDWIISAILGGSLEVGLKSVALKLD